MSPTSFRIMTLGSVAIGLLGGLIDFIIPGLVPPALAREVMDHDPVTSGLGLIGFGLLLAAVLLGGVASVVGLCLFRAWGRTLAVAVTLLSLPLAVVVGVTFSSGWAYAAGTVSCTLWGVVLASAYHAPLSERFRRGGR